MERSEQKLISTVESLAPEILDFTSRLVACPSTLGKEAPVLVTSEMLAGMPPGSVVVDLAAERGGNVEPSRPDETVVEHGVTVYGPTNLPSDTPYHASQMYAKNITTFLLHLVEEGELNIDTEDEITGSTLVTRGGEVVNARVREALGSATRDTGEKGES